MRKYIYTLLLLLILDFPSGLGKLYNPFFYSNSGITFFTLILYWCYLLTLLIFIWNILIEYLKMGIYIKPRIKNSFIMYLIKTILPKLCICVTLKSILDLFFTEFDFLLHTKIYISTVISLFNFLVLGIFILLIFNNIKVSMLFYVLISSTTIFILNISSLSLFNLIPNHPISLEYLLAKLFLSFCVLTITILIEYKRKDFIIYD